MKTIITLTATLLTAYLLAGCETAVEQDTNIDKTISLIELNDLHAHLTPHLDYNYNDGQPNIVNKGGLARIASAIKQLRNDNPNTILMNIGDTFHGGVEALYTNGNAIVDPVNELNIDIGVPGNWDYAYGPSVTRIRYTGQGRNPQNIEIKPVNYPSLAANVTSTTRTPFLPATTIIERDGIKLGFIGFSSDIVPRMFAGFAIGFDFLQGKQNYIDLLNTTSQTLRDNGANVIILMSELGIHKDIALADAINANSVDVIFSAHTHELTPEPIQSNSGTIIVESGNDTYLGHMDLHFDNKQKLINTTWEVLTIDMSYAEDASMLALVNASRAPFLGDNVNINFPNPAVSQTLTQPIDSIIANSAFTLDRRQALENSFNSAFTQTLNQYAGTDVSMITGFRYDSIIPGSGYLFEDSSIANGDISIEDAYRFFPVTFNLASGQVSGARLKSVIEENLNSVFSTDSFDHSGGWFDGFSGIDLTLDLSMPVNQRIVDIKLSNTQQPILDTDTLNISGCVRPIELDAGNTLCSYDGFTNITALINPTTQAPWTAIDFLIDQLSNAQFTSPNNSHINDLNNTLMWPESEYVQPLQGAK